MRFSLLFAEEQQGKEDGRQVPISPSREKKVEMHEYREAFVLKEHTRAYAFWIGLRFFHRTCWRGSVNCDTQTGTRFSLKRNLLGHSTTSNHGICLEFVYHYEISRVNSITFWIVNPPSPHSPTPFKTYVLCNRLLGMSDSRLFCCFTAKSLGFKCYSRRWSRNGLQERCHTPCRLRLQCALTLYKVLYPLCPLSFFIRYFSTCGVFARYFFATFHVLPWPSFTVDKAISVALSTRPLF